MSDLAFVCRNPQEPVSLPPRSGLYEFMARSIYENVAGAVVFVHQAVARILKVCRPNSGGA